MYTMFPILPSYQNGKQQCHSTSLLNHALGIGILLSAVHNRNLRLSFLNQYALVKITIRKKGGGGGNLIWVVGGK